MRGDTVQDVDKVMVSHLGMDIESMNMIEVVLDSTCLLKITDVVKCPIWLVVVAIVLPNGILDLFLYFIPVPISFPLFQCFSFCT